MNGYLIQFKKYLLRLLFYVHICAGVNTKWALTNFKFVKGFVFKKYLHILQKATKEKKIRGFFSLQNYVWEKNTL